jgi:hypothetical protein
MESGLIFNQLICEFESRRPRQILLLSMPKTICWRSDDPLNRQSAIENRQFLMWAVAQLLERCSVTAEVTGQSPVGPPIPTLNRQTKGGQQ